MASWWEKKLGGGQQPAPPAPPPPRTQSPYAPVLPPGMGHDHDGVLQRYMERNGITQPNQQEWQPQPQQQQPAPPPGSIQLTQVGPNEVALPGQDPSFQMSVDGDPNNYHRRMWGWTGDPRYGAGETNNTGSCPHCGSPRFFSRSNAEGAGIGSGGITTKEGKMYPAPECFDCGYPRQQGTLASQPSTRDPNVRSARTVPLSHTIAPDGSLATLIKH